MIASVGSNARVQTVAIAILRSLYRFPMINAMLTLVPRHKSHGPVVIVVNDLQAFSTVAHVVRSMTSILTRVGIIIVRNYLLYRAEGLFFFKMMEDKYKMRDVSIRIVPHFWQHDFFQIETDF